MISTIENRKKRDSYPARNRSVSYNDLMKPQGRRPSENLFNVIKNNAKGYNNNNNNNNNNTSMSRPSSTSSSSSSSSYDMIRQNRPTSEDSTHSRNTEIFSMWDNNDGDNITNPSVYSVNSVSNKNSTIDLKSSLSSPSITTARRHRYMTPSQRYRLRKLQSDNSLRNIMKNNDDLILNNDDLILNNNDNTNNNEDSIINEDILWNIPTSETILSCHNDSFVLPDVTSIPGINPNEHDDLSFMNRLSQSLTQSYKDERKRDSWNRYSSRLKSTESLPLEFKQLSDLGLEDMKLVSNEKMGIISESRPIWLPPKNQYESKCHQRMINKQMDQIAHDSIQKNKWLKDYKLSIMQNYKLLNEGENKQRLNLMQIVKEMPLPYNLRLSIYKSCIEQTQTFVSLTDMETHLNKIDFPQNQELIISRIINDNISKHIFINNNVNNMNVLSKLNHLLKLRSISQGGIMIGDEIIIYNLLIKNYQIDEIWIILQMIQNRLQSIELDSKKNDINDMNMITIWNVLERIDNSDLFLWIMDIMIILNQYNLHKLKKFIIAIFKVVNKDYHYGFETFTQLKTVTEFKIMIPGDDCNDLLYRNHHFINKLFKSM